MSIRPMQGQLQSLRHEIGSMTRPDTVREPITKLSPGGKAQVLQWLVRFMGQAFPGIEHTAGVSGGEACLLRTLSIFIYRV